MRDKLPARADAAAFGQAKRRGDALGNGPSARASASTPNDRRPTGQLLPVYPLTEGLTQRHVRQLVRAGVGRLRRIAGRSVSAGLSARRTICWPIHAAVAADALSDQPREPRTGPAAVHLSGAVHSATGAGASSGSKCTIRCGRSRLELTAKIDARIRRLFPFELTAGPEPGDRRNRRRHGPRRTR